MIFGTLSFRGCGGQPLALLWIIRVKSQMPIPPEHALKEESTKLLILLKFVHFRKPLTRSSFLSKSVVIFAEIKTKSVKMTTLFERNEDRVTGFLKWTDFRSLFTFFTTTKQIMKFRVILNWDHCPQPNTDMKRTWMNFNPAIQESKQT